MSEISSVVDRPQDILVYSQKGDTSTKLAATNPSRILGTGLSEYIRGASLAPDLSILTANVVTS